MDIAVRRLLFNEGEVMGFKVKPEWKPQPFSPSCCYFALNPLKDYSEAANNNVSAHRNFLFEMDGPALAQQTLLLETQRELPFATKTFSGNKSYHYIVALDTDIGPDKYKEHWALLKWLFKDTALDKGNSNPSRLTRTPGCVHATTQKEQRLVSVGRRISLDEWEHWLYESPRNKLDAWQWREGGERERVEARAQELAMQRVTGQVPEWVAELIAQGADRIVEGNRHRTLVAAAVAGTPEPELVELAELMGKSADEATRLFLWNCRQQRE